MCVSVARKKLQRNREESQQEKERARQQKEYDKLTVEKRAEIKKKLHDFSQVYAAISVLSLPALRSNSRST